MEVKTLNEIRIKGFRVLVKNLGPADAIRFIRCRELPAWSEKTRSAYAK